jgi:neutral amino acid transport system permease protein
VRSDNVPTDVPVESTRRRARPDGPGRLDSRALALVVMLVAMLVVPLMALSAAPAGAVPGCLAQKDQTGCISGTVGSRANPVAGADVTLLDADGAEVETQTTEADGKFAFTVTEAGDFFVKLDNDTLPKGLEQRPPAKSFEGPDGSLRVKVTLGKTAIPALEVRSEDYEEGGSSKSDKIISGAANGLKLGLLLALASLGLSLIYGTTGISNFAHAEQVTLGGILAYAIIMVWMDDGASYPFGLSPPTWIVLTTGIVLVTVISAFSGWLQDVVLWTPLRRRGLGLTQLMIVTIGLSLAAQYTFQYFIGASQVKVTLQSSEVHTFGPIRLTTLSLVAMGVSVVAIAAVGFVLLRTRIGQATRAVSENPGLAAASGIDVDKIVRLVWTSAAGLAGLSGVLYALTVSNGVRWDTGMQILLLLFAATTLGGLGTAFGALIGSLVIGFVVELAGPLGAPGDLKYAVALGILIVLLVFRPQGLLGRAARVG